jgi:flagellar hook-associated protein 2
MADATFRAGGLASGIDTNSIIDQLVKLESRPIDLVRKQQAGLQAQVSALGDIMSKLAELSNAATALGDIGTLGTRVSSTHTGFAAVSDSKATAGRYDVQVNTVATAARARSQAFGAATDPVAGGTLTLHVMGQQYDIDIADGTQLADVALAIRQSGAPVSATVLSNGSNAYLSITNLNTGYPIGGAPGDALTIDDGPVTQALGLAITQTAANSVVTVDGLAFTRQSNTLTDVIPGVTMSLKATTAAPETLVVDHDAEATAKNLQKFVDAYNGVLKLVQRQLSPAPDSDRSVTLAGDASLRGLQRTLQALTSQQVGAGTVRTLADLGIKTARDGSLSLDTVALGKAISRDPAAVNDLFSHASTGLGATVKALVKNANDFSSGTLSARKKGLGDSIRHMDDQAAVMELRLEGYRKLLVDQFTAMERVVSELRATGNFLSQQTFPPIGGNNS